MTQSHAAWTMPFQADRTRPSFIPGIFQDKWMVGLKSDLHGFGGISENVSITKFEHSYHRDKDAS